MNPFPIRRLLCIATAAAMVAALPLSAVRAADAPPIKVGLLMPLKTVIGRQGKQGADLAAEMVNEQGGVLGRRLELVNYDTNFSAVEGVSAARRLIDQDKVQFIAGEISSTPALAILQIARATNTLFMVAVPKHPDLTKSGYDRVFRLNTTLDGDANYTNKYLDDKYKPTKVAVVAENSDYGRYSIEASKKYFGSRFVAGETFELTQNDFTTLMSKVKASGADAACIVAGKPEQAAAALRAMSQLGLQARRCLAVGVLNEQSLALAGDTAEGAFGADIYTASVPNAVNEQFVKRFKARYGNTPEKIEALGFESVWLVAKGIAAAGTATDTAKVAAALHKGVWATPRGEVSFDQGGQALSKRYVDFVVKGGKLIATE
ncbi:MAG: Amino acid/amide transporter substrate-binding protein family [Rhizobacter sp.]|nr:Amino acid/amide transporter substrate-binding protein family [Rhizobacter sp.]